MKIVTLLFSCLFFINLAAKAADLHNAKIKLETACFNEVDYPSINESMLVVENASEDISESIDLCNHKINWEINSENQASYLILYHLEIPASYTKTERKPPK